MKRSYASAATSNTELAYGGPQQKPIGGVRPQGFVDSVRGDEADRDLRLGRRRAHRSPRVPGHDVARGLHLPGRRSAVPVRAAAGRRDQALRARARNPSGRRGREADRGRAQLRDRRGAPVAPGAPVRAGHRRAFARGTHRGPGDAEPPDRGPGHRGDRRERALRAGDPRARRRSDRRLGRVPEPRADDRGRRRCDLGDRRGGSWLCGAAPRRGGRHGHPRLHALPAHPPGVRAGLRPLDDPRLLGRRGGARGGRDARAEGRCPRSDTSFRMPLHDDRLAGGVSRARRALPPASDPRGGARRPRDAGARRGMSREGRRPDELRPLTIEHDYVEQADGSALISFGKTRVLCTASVDEGVPRWLAGSGRGWLTAEYGMLPASTGERRQRDVAKGRPDGRTVEIQRLIGRSLRGVIERTPLTGSVAAVSCGIVGGAALLDLDYSEDSTAEVDANVVMTGDGGLVEVQATAERTPLSRASLDELLALAAAGIQRLRTAQQDAVAAAAAAAA